MKKYYTLLILSSIILAGFIPYINSLQNPFIWDEEVMIVGNPIIKEWRYLPHLFKTNIFGSPIDAGGYFRPLYMFSFMLDYQFWELNTTGYHLFNVGLHILNGLLLYLLVLKLGLQRKIAWIASLLFLLFPVNSETVTVIAGRGELLLVLPSLLCIISFLNGIKRSRFYFLGSIFFFILAIFAKENALLLPFILLLYIFILLEKEKRRKAYLALSILISIAFIYCVLRFIILGSPFSRTLSLINEASFLERIYTFPRILWTYIRLLVFPIALKSEYHFVVRTFKDMYVWLGTPLLILLFVGLYRFLKPKKHVLFFLCWFLVGLLVYSNVALPLHATLTEHWVYLSSMGFAVLMSIVILNIMEKITSQRIKYIFTIVFIFIMGFYAFKIIERNKEWKDPFELYKTDVKKEPNSFLLRCNLGVEYFRRGMMEEAKREFMASNEVCPGLGYDIAYNNLGVIYAGEGKLQEAIAHYKLSIALNNYNLAYANLGRLYNNLKMYKDALLVLKKGAKLYPLDIEIKYQLGIAYYGNGELILAKKIFKEVEDLHKTYSETEKFLDLIERDSG